MVKFILTPSQLSLVFLLLSCPDPAALVVFLVLVLQPWCCRLGPAALVWSPWSGCLGLAVFGPVALVSSALVSGLVFVSCHRLAPTL